ncbi:MAG: 1-acyl-sn-glycerol-3-phosphate acyltransferase [Desulfosalsimonadaceae bacterium]
MKLYRISVWLLRVFSHLYFVEMRSLNPERIPESGPVILAANHPTSILDAILLAMQTSRQIHFLGKSDLFRNRWVEALLRRLGVVPVYRTHEAESHRSRNLEVFEKVYELFERGGCLGLFPEGRNSPAGRVAALRTGGARMALGAEARNNYELGLSIVPAGLTFEHRELFMTAVLLRFGPPISVAAYAELHRQDPEKAVRQLTENLQKSMRRQAMHVEDDQMRELAEDLSEALGYRLAPLALDKEKQNGSAPKSRSGVKRWMWKLLDWYRPDAGDISAAFETRVQDRQQLTDILTRAAAFNPSSVLALRRKVDRYLDHLHQTELSRNGKQSLEAPVRERLIRLRMTIYALVMAPVALFGLAHNVAPYLFAKYLARLSRDEAIRAFAYFGVGFLAFTLAYCGFGFWLWYFAGMGWKLVLGYLALLPPSGFAALRYRRNILVYRNKILVRTFFWNNEELIRLLRRERQGVIERFRELKGLAEGG